PLQSDPDCQPHPSPADRRAPLPSSSGLPGVPPAGRDHDVHPVEDAADAALAQSDGPGTAAAADAANHGADLAADDRLVRAQRPRRPGPLLVWRELRKYHSAELRGRVGPALAVAGQTYSGSAAFGAQHGPHRNSKIDPSEERTGPERDEVEPDQKAQEPGSKTRQGE